MPHQLQKRWPHSSFVFLFAIGLDWIILRCFARLITAYNWIAIGKKQNINYIWYSHQTIWREKFSMATTSFKAWFRYYVILAGISYRQIPTLDYLIWLSTKLTTKCKRLRYREKQIFEIFNIHLPFGVLVSLAHFLAPILQRKRNDAAYLQRIVFVLIWYAYNLLDSYHFVILNIYVWMWKMSWNRQYSIDFLLV